jgi:serine protease Do
MIRIRGVERTCASAARGLTAAQGDAIVPRMPRRFFFSALVAVVLGLAGPVYGASKDLQDSIVDVQTRALTALVNIQPVTESYTRGERRKQSSVGSGFLVDSQGHIVTNYHVAGRAKQLMVTLSNKERIEAELVGEDPLTDLAVIRIPAEKVKELGLRPLSFGSSSKLQVGQFVAALGSPLALARTMTFGIVSNTERYLPDGMSLPTGERTGEFNTWVQTDAAINPGNSGGPLIDLKGRVVGVNARGATFADNIGFAIPADTARRVVSDLIEFGEVKRSYAGIRFQPLKDWQGLFDLEEGLGALVSSVEQGGPGETAGLRAGDVVLKWGDTEVGARFDEELPGLYQLIADADIGKAIPLTILRRDEGELTVELKTVETGKLQGERFEAEAWGFAVKGITDQMVFDLELDTADGVWVEGVRTGGPAHRGKLRRGRVVHSVEGRSVDGLASFQALYEELKDQDVVLIARRFDSKSYVLVKTQENGK